MLEKVTLITKTEGLNQYKDRSLDEIVVGIARVSSSRETNELFDEAYKLIRHCILHQHWSVFEMANLTFEIKTSRAMGRELLRHGVMGIQEFSQRYAEVNSFESIEIRQQAKNNRQSSSENINPVLETGITAEDAVATTVAFSQETYKMLLNSGVARESARLILPETATSTLILNGRLREWITFLNVRLHKTAQKEIREIAEAIRDEFIKECPLIAKALFNFDNAYEVHIIDRLVLEKYKVYHLIDKK